MHKSIFFIVFLGLFSCRGLKPGESPVNIPIPKEFADRTVFPTDLAGANRFQDLAGSIITFKAATTPIFAGLARPDSYVAVSVPITDPNTYYKSRIQKGAEIQGGYLQFAAGFTADQMAELELIDISWAGISFDTETPWNQVIKKAQTWVETHPKTDTTIKRWWIKEVTLTRRVFTSYAKIKADASGTVGPIVGLKAGIYNNNDNSVKSVIIGLVAYDIDQMVAQSKSVQGLAGQSTTVLKFSKVGETFMADTLNISTVIPK
jgi:hypothetical protein